MIAVSGKHVKLSAARTDQDQPINQKNSSQDQECIKLSHNFQPSTEQSLSDKNIKYHPHANYNLTFFDFPDIFDLLGNFGLLDTLDPD